MTPKKSRESTSPSAFSLNSAMSAIHCLPKSCQFMSASARVWLILAAQVFNVCTRRCLNQFRFCGGRLEGAPVRCAWSTSAVERLWRFAGGEVVGQQTRLRQSVCRNPKRRANAHTEQCGIAKAQYRQHYSHTWLSTDQYMRLQPRSQDRMFGQRDVPRQSAKDP